MFRILSMEGVGRVREKSLGSHIQAMGFDIPGEKGI